MRRIFLALIPLACAVSADAATVTQGTITAAAPQPAFSDLSGTASVAQLANAESTVVSTLTASGSASLAWTGLTGDSYKISCKGIILAGASGLVVQTGTGATPTWNTTGYKWATRGPARSMRSTDE